MASRVWKILAVPVILARCGEAAPPSEPVLNAEARIFEGTIIESAPRLFNAPELDSLQRLGAIPVTFTVTPDTVVLAPGEAIALSRLGFDARTASNEPIPELPILLTLDTDIAAIESDSLRGLRNGEGILWARSLVGRVDGDPGEPIRIIVR